MELNEFTKEEAVALAASNWWEDVSHKAAAEFQLMTPRLCMPLDLFQEYLQEALGRPVFTHELGLNVDGLRKELYSEAPAPTLDEIIGLLPREKVVLVVPDE